MCILIYRMYVSLNLLLIHGSYTAEAIHIPNVDLTSSEGHDLVVQPAHKRRPDVNAAILTHDAHAPPTPGHHPPICICRPRVTGVEQINNLNKGSSQNLHIIMNNSNCPRIVSLYWNANKI